MGDDGIVRMTMQPGVYDLELTDAREVIQAVNSLSGGVRRPVLVDLREVRSMSRDCRKYFAGPETAAAEAAAALLVVSPIARAIGNFFMGLNKPLLPTRLFTSEADALTWLRGFVT
ncbi:MAG TPA: hypothetical protein VIX73_21340 [Kofleriaceae bacterium]